MFRRLPLVCSNRPRSHPENVRALYPVVAMALSICLGPQARGAVEYTLKDLGNFKPTGINEIGQVVGYSTDLPGYGSSDDTFFYDGSRLVDLTRTYGLNGAPWALNSRGQIAGWNYDPTIINGVSHAYLFASGTISHPTDLGGWSIPLALNDSGQAVGNASSSSVETDPRYPAIFSNSGFTLLSTTPGTAFSINSHGQVVGELGSPESHHAFLYSAGTLTDLGTLGGPTSNAIFVSDSGQVIGNSDGDVFLYKNGTMTDVGHVTVGGHTIPTYADFANDEGTIVGDYGTNRLTPYVYRNGQFRDLSSVVDPSLEIEWLSVNGINNAGQIIAYGNVLSTSPASTIDAFLLTPIPEPSAAGLTILGSTLLLRRRQSSRVAPVRFIECGLPSMPPTTPIARWAW